MRSFILSLVISIGFLLLSVIAIRHRRLHDQAAVLWLVVSLVMVFLSLTLPLHLLDHVAHLVGIAYPPDLLLLVAVLFLVVLVFQLSVSLARLSAKHTTLVQDIGILTTRPPEMPGEATDHASEEDARSDPVGSTVQNRPFPPSHPSTKV
jgi:hypothetical protein